MPIFQDKSCAGQNNHFDLKTFLVKFNEIKNNYQKFQAPQ